MSTLYSDPRSVDEKKCGVAIQALKSDGEPVVPQARELALPHDERSSTGV